LAKTIKTRVQNKHATEAEWKRATAFVPLAGELIIYDVDETHATQRIKVGDGVLNPATNKVEGTPINDLGFIDSGITFGTADPNADTDSQFYFKYSTM
jgi:hypothetical protein